MLIMAYIMIPISYIVKLNGGWERQCSLLENLSSCHTALASRLDGIEVELKPPLSLMIKLFEVPVRVCNVHSIWGKY